MPNVVVNELKVCFYSLLNTQHEKADRKGKICRRVGESLLPLIERVCAAHLTSEL